MNKQKKFRERNYSYYMKIFESMSFSNEDKFTDEQIESMDEESVNNFIELIESNPHIYKHPVFKKFVIRIKDIHAIV